MADKKIVEWVLAQRAAGYDDKTLKNYLVKHGHNIEKINGAFNYLNITKKGTKKFYAPEFLKIPQKLSWKVMFLFILSSILVYFFTFVFFSYSSEYRLGWTAFAEYFLDAISNIPFIFLLCLSILIILFICAVLGRHINLFSNSVFLSVVIIACVFLFNGHLSDYGVFFLSIFTIFALLHSLKYRVCSKKYDFLSVFFILLISWVFAFSLSILVHLFLVYGVIRTLSIDNLMLITFILTISIGVLIGFYQLISLKLLNKFFGEFDHNAFFRFKHIPFSAVNILSRKDGNIKKSITKSTAIIYVLILVLSLIGVATFQTIFISELVTRFNDGILKSREYHYNSQVKFDDPELDNLQISKELAEEFNNAFLINKKIDLPDNAFARVAYICLGGGFNDILYEVSNGITQTTINLGFAIRARMRLPKEYAWLKEEINESKFYDSSTEIEEHTKNLRDNLAYFYEGYKKYEADKYNDEISTAESGNIITPSIFDASLNTALKNVFSYKQTNFSSSVIRLYEKRDIEESAISKVLRLRILQKEFADGNMKLCNRDFDCEQAIVYRVKDINLCNKYRNLKDLEQCYNITANGNVRICDRLESPLQKGKCVSVVTPS